MKVFYDLDKAAKIERWQQAVRVLSKLPKHVRENHWDMETWGNKTDCGTVACAAGHCGMDTWFRRRGLSLKIKFNNNGESVVENFGSAVEVFFGREGVDAIFLNQDTRPAAQVVKEIRGYIKFLKKNLDPDGDDDDSEGFYLNEWV